MDHYSIKVPFFGVTLDANDLGMIGGLGLLVTLGFLWFSLARERDNLKWSFDAAKPHGDEELRKMYYLLAMRQVLTSTPAHEWKGLPAALPKALVLLPVFVQSAVLVNDIWSFHVGSMICLAHTVLVLLVESFWLILMGFVTSSCSHVFKDIDKLWLDMWELVNQG